MGRNNEDFQDGKDTNAAFSGILKASYPEDIPGFEGTTDSLNSLVNIRKNTANKNKKNN